MQNILFTISLSKISLLSRPRYYLPLHGLTNEYRDYISIVKNQGKEGLCWAYSLASAIEIKYEMETGNRLMLNPKSIANGTKKFWKDINVPKKGDEQEIELIKNCKTHSKEEEDNPVCVILYMAYSKHEVEQMDGNNSFLYISNFTFYQFNTIKDIYDALDKSKILYTSINALDELPYYEVFDDYVENEDINHQVVITSIGKLINEEGNLTDGIYLEVLNSWGYNVHYDGLFYVKIADSEDSILHNNLQLLSLPIGIEVLKRDSSDFILVIALVFGILFLISFITNILVCIIYHNYRKTNLTNLANQETEIESLKTSLNNELNDDKTIRV